MKFRITAAAAAVVIIIAFSSCQQVFTASALSWVETDITTMSDTQKVSYAEDLLSAPPTEENLLLLAEAYAEIAALLPDDLSTADSDLLILAADLAVGSSGIGVAVNDALSVVAGGTADEAALTDMLASLDAIDTTNLSSAVDLITAAENNGAELTSEQYANAAAAQLLVVADAADGIENLSTVDPADPDLVQAQTWAAAAGIDIEALLTGGLPA